MSKWINIDDLPSGRVEWDDIFDAPSIDIVRCKECENFIQMTHGCKRSPSVEPWWEDDFCSYGEREGE